MRLCHYLEAGHSRHSNVGQDDIRRGGGKHFDRLTPTERRHHLVPVAPKQNAKRVEDARLVIHQENLPLPVHTAASCFVTDATSVPVPVPGNRTTNRVPPAGTSSTYTAPPCAWTAR